MEWEGEELQCHLASGRRKVNPEGDSCLRMIVASLERRSGESENSSSSNIASPAFTELWREEM
jgi:hypothetical protein